MQMQLVEKKEFRVAVPDPEDEIFIVHVVSLTIFDTNKMHPFCRVQIALLEIDYAFTTISLEYSDFVEVFSPELIVEFPKYMEISNHAIDLIDVKQPLYGFMYSSELMKLET